MAKHDVELENFSKLFSLDGKVAVVSGGSRGLGLHAASGLMQAGCSKVYITSRKAAACEEACAALNALPNKAAGAKAIPIAADGSKVKEIERLVAEVSKTTDKVDILFANAGATWGSPFEKHTESSYDKVLDLNVKSVFFMAQKFLPLMQKAGTAKDPSRLVVTASVAGIGIGATGEHSTPSYSTSKAAVIHLMRHLAVDFKGRNVLCNAIAPGFFPSKMANGLIDLSGGVEKMGAESPNGRVGNANDIAGTVVYLCSRAASHANGTVIPLDGGKMWARAEL